MTTDASLVEAARAGDQAAFASLYDRYSNRVFSLCATLTRDRGLAEDATADTFLVAWQRLDQLRNPSQVRPWLFAIARNRVGRLGARAARQQPVDPVADELDRSQVGDPDAVDLGDQVSAHLDAEAATRLVWEAADGLNDNERAVLELSVRQGLEGEELAAALGMTRHHTNVVAGRMRTNLERSVGALYLLRVGAGDCDELEHLVDGFDGALTPLWRKRVSRHSDACEVCGRSRSLKPVAMFAAVPIFAAPATARAAVLDALPTRAGGAPEVDHSTYRADRAGFPHGAAAARRRAVLVAGSAAAVVALVVAWLVWPDRSTSEQVVTGPTSTTMVSSAPTSGPEATTVPERPGSTETTEPPAAETTTTRPANDAAAPTPDDPGSSADPAPQPGPAPPPSIVLAPPPDETTTTAPDTSAPTITDVDVSPTSLKQIGCAPGAQTATVTVTAQDDRGITSGEVEVRVGPSVTTASLSGSGSVVAGTIGPLFDTGSLEVTVLWVADAAGNRSAPATPVFGAVTC